MTVGTDEVPRTDDVTPSTEELLRLRLAVEASSEVIFMTDATGTIRYVNPEFVRLYGYTPSEVVGRTTPRILKAGLTSKAEYDAFWTQLLKHEVVRREFLNRTKSGTLIHVESSANPIVNGADLVGFVAVQRDITARKATEAALRDSERRYRTLAEAAHDSIFIVDRDARIQYANAVSTARFGCSSKDAIGKKLTDVFRTETADEIWREVSAVFASGERQYRETRFDTPQGELWLGTWLVPLAGETTPCTTVMGVARDITDRKALERQFLQAQKMEAIGQLAGGIAHDFNNLLTAILGYTDLVIERAGSDGEFVGDLQEVRNAAERATRLTRQLLAFSRKQLLAPQVVDLNQLVTELHRILTRVIGENIHVDIVPESGLHSVKADPSQIEQVLMNLAVNARDAMPQGGTLRIATANVKLDTDFARKHAGAVPGQYVALSVRDSGCGMPADVLAHAFEPFFTTKPAGKGTGLGLATVYGIVKQSGGYITIESTPGSGTTVTTYLPSLNTTAAASATTRARLSVSGTETILVVEDDPGVQRLIERSITRLGYTVLPAQSSNHALELAENYSGSIDLLLSDVIMPGLNGPDLAQRIVGLRPSIKVLYVSGYSNHPALTSGSSRGRIAFLPKPFTRQALAEKIRECLDVQLDSPKGA